MYSFDYIFLLLKKHFPKMSHGNILFFMIWKSQAAVSVQQDWQNHNITFGNQLHKGF